MPIYEYSCSKCNNVFEEWSKSHTDSEQATCPQCGVVASQIISNTSFVLKGGGWYVTDYGNRKNQVNSGDSEQAPTPSQNDKGVKPTSSSNNSLDKKPKPETKVKPDVTTAPNASKSAKRAAV